MRSSLVFNHFFWALAQSLSLEIIIDKIFMSTTTRRLFSTHIGTNPAKKFTFQNNPILFNVRNERYVV
jgi:hypothetical protein